MKKIIILLALFLISAFAAVFYFSHIRRGSNYPVIIINNHKFSVEIADDPRERSRGLGGRENLCADCGMLFVFNKLGRYTFWMKDMKFPLDFIWIAGDKIVDIDENISPDHSGTLKPGYPADKVLEINAGAGEKHGIEVGDGVKF